MKKLISFLLAGLLLFSAAISVGAASADEVGTDEAAAEAIVTETVEDESEIVQTSAETEEEPPTTVDEGSYDDAPDEELTEPPTEAPTEPPTEPEESPYRYAVPKVEKVSFSSGSYENTLTLYADSLTGDGQENYEFMKRYGNHYRWYYKSNDGWTRIGTTTENTFTWYPTERGRSYTFTVRCTNRNDDRFISDFDRTGNTLYYCRTPGSLKATVEGNYVRFTFDRCYGANKYAIYRQIEDGWKRIAVTTNGYYVDKTPTPESVNTYTVRCINDNENVFWSNFKHAGVSVYMPEYVSNVQLRREKLVKLMNHIADDIKIYPNGYYARGDIYWEESGIPEGADWCTGFAHYMLNKGLGGYYACQWDDLKDSPSYWHPYTDEWSRTSYYEGKIFYQPWDREVPTVGDIVFYRDLGEKDIFANVGHVGLVYKVYENGDIDAIEGNIGDPSPLDSRTMIVHYTKSGNTWVSKERAISGYIDLDKIIENGEKYPQNAE